MFRENYIELTLNNINSEKKMEFRDDKYEILIRNLRKNVPEMSHPESLNEELLDRIIRYERKRAGKFIVLRSLTGIAAVLLLFLCIREVIYPLPPYPAPVSTHLREEVPVCSRQRSIAMDFHRTRVGVFQEINLLLSYRKKDQEKRKQWLKWYESLN